MTDSKSNDHWNFLARQLGAVPDTGPEEETTPPEPAEQVEPPADVAESFEPSAAAAEIIELQPEPAPAEETTAVWQSRDSQRPYSASQAPAPPRAPAPKPKAPIIGENWQARSGLRLPSPNRRNRRSPKKLRQSTCQRRSRRRNLRRQ